MAHRLGSLDPRNAARRLAQSRLKPALTRLTGQEKAFGLLVAAVIGFVGFMLVSGVQAAHDQRVIAKASLATAQQAVADRQAAQRTLNRKIDMLTSDNTSAARQRGRLRAQVRALAEQLTAAGVTPVVVVTAHPRPTARPTHHHGAHHHHPGPRKPSPSPSARCVQVTSACVPIPKLVATRP